MLPNIRATLLGWSIKLETLSRDLSNFFKLLELRQWEAPITGTGSLTFTVTQAQSDFRYFCILDRYVIFWGYAVGTTAGTGSTLLVKLPFSTQYPEFRTPVICSVFDGAAYSGNAYIDPDDGNTVRITRYNIPNWGTGAARWFSIAGFFVKEKKSRG